ncbi:hypothetical protein [Acinetobacter johnsonii]|uniref:hypothetical protein n=1 Tax=Acinetobacter TaxID=469 RepID=UPI0032B470A1
MDDKELLTKSDSFTPMMTWKRSTLTFDFGLPARPIPPDIPTPPIVNLYGDEPNDQSGNDLVHGWDWILVWFFGFCFGIFIGLLISKFS